MTSVLDERIRQRAYDIWMSEGCPEGRHEEHWHRAAAELRAETAVGGEAPAPAKARTRGKAAAGAAPRRGARKVEPAAGDAPTEIPAGTEAKPRARKAAAGTASAAKTAKAPAATSGAKGRQGRTGAKSRSPALG
ncbi:DUF2934 domain-containing protein [Arenibaculum pallidiluteum]|uniref:DUF2934 domain-containing protein n=1 Tax=Arenibaculum pallidiluteum TaxID=2812559 RepID=UPI001A96CB5B|nr:DUF2934 domain-containing protein [Arenibaculum pallidiluteum]